MLGCVSTTIGSIMQGLTFQRIDAPAHPQLPALRELLLEYQRWLGVDLCFQSFEEEIAQLPGSYAPPDGRLYVAFVGHEVAGCIALRRLTAQDAEMKRLYLRPAFQGQGLGRQLAQQIVNDARSIGYQRMLLDTLPKLDAAIALYQSMGFQEIDRYNDNFLEGVRFMALAL
jgi:putative acetyltransferase